MMIGGQVLIFSHSLILFVFKTYAHSMGFSREALTMLPIMESSSTGEGLSWRELFLWARDQSVLRWAGEASFFVRQIIGMISPQMFVTLFLAGFLDRRLLPFIRLNY